MRMGNDGKPIFLSNHAGGILGGISTGQPVIARFAIKPTSSILTERQSIDSRRQQCRCPHQGPPRPLRRHPRRADRRGDGCLRHCRSLSSRPRPDRPAEIGTNPMAYDQKRVVDALRAFEAGEIVVVMDDDGRENEGDLIVAAVHCTPEKMAFIVRHTSGIVCTPMPKEEAKRLNLNAMVAENDSAHTTAFTVTVDFKHGTTTGISAEDRTLTVRNLANPNVGAADFVRPGHIFPLIAREGGVLMRSGHTEAAVDLCRSPACRRSA
jgi:3,4-dihydroxy-2-butanone 4-phosphate synthase